MCDTPTKTSQTETKNKKQKHRHYLHDAAASYQIWQNACAEGCSTADEVMDLSSKNINKVLQFSFQNIIILQTQSMKNVNIQTLT